MEALSEQSNFIVKSKLKDFKDARAAGASIAISLNQDTEAPLYGLINISGKRDQGKTIHLNSFVSSLEKLLRDTSFASLKDKDKLRFVKTIWKAIRRILPQAFDSETLKEYMLLKALGPYSINCSEIASHFHSFSR